MIKLITPRGAKGPVRLKDDPRLLLSNDDFSKHTSEKALVSEIKTQPAAIAQFKSGNSNLRLQPKTKQDAGTRLK